METKYLLLAFGLLIVMSSDILKSMIPSVGAASEIRSALR